jgi:hypothetical protein
MGFPLNRDPTRWPWQDGKAHEVGSRFSLTSRREEHDHAMCEQEGDPLMKARRTYEGRDEPPKPKR